MWLESQGCVHKYVINIGEIVTSFLCTEVNILSDEVGEPTASLLFTYIGLDIG